MEELMSRNTQLENQLREFKEREEVLTAELKCTRVRLHFVEEAEERLCFQMGELEAEAMEQARAYQLHVKELSEQLAAALGLLRSTNSIVQLEPGRRVSGASASPRKWANGESGDNTRN
jgi:hypothetical protein